MLLERPVLHTYISVSGFSVCTRLLTLITLIASFITGIAGRFDF